MLDKKLMKLALDCPDLMKKYHLTDCQANIVKFARDSGYGSITARELADRRGISVQSASGQLNSLWHRGWLKREERAATTGGIEYRYSSVV